MAESENQKLIEDLARKTLEQIEPGSKELKQFDIYSEEYFKSPKKALEGMEVKDRPLGSGFGIGEIILIPFLLWLGGKITDKVTDKLLEHTLSFAAEDMSKDEPSSPILRFIKQFLRKVGFEREVKTRPLELSMLPSLTITEKQELRKETLADPEVKALVSRYNLSNELVVKLVDAMVANLPINSNQSL
jgi:hypothetical protein